MSNFFGAPGAKLQHSPPQEFCWRFRKQNSEKTKQNKGPENSETWLMDAVLSSFFLNVDPGFRSKASSPNPFNGPRTTIVATQDHKTQAACRKYTWHASDALPAASQSHYISQSILVAAFRKNTCHASDALPAKTPWAMTMATSPQITHRTPLNKITTTSQIALQLQRLSRSHKHLRPDLSSASFPSLALRTLARPCILQTF